MATYNGARYLPAQLASIASQSRRPDEVVIGDDQSSDETGALVAEFAERHKDIEVRFQRNAMRLGSSANFEAAARRTQCSLVVFSDQDDIWMPNRLERLQTLLNAHPEHAYAFSNGTFIDGAGLPVAGTLFDSIDFDLAERRAFQQGRGMSVLLRRNVVTGATLAVRRDLLMSVLPVPAGWVHDYFLALMLEATASGLLIDEPLIRYRRHDAQQVGVASNSLQAAMFYARKQDAAQCRAEASAWQQLEIRLAATPLNLHAPQHSRGQDSLLASVRAKQDFFGSRAQMRERPWWAPWLMLRLAAAGEYSRFSLGLKQWLVDALAILAVGRSVR